jgi:hypothetical protein
LIVQDGSVPIRPQLPRANLLSTAMKAAARRSENSALNAFGKSGLCEVAAVSSATSSPAPECCKVAGNTEDEFEQVLPHVAVVGRRIAVSQHRSTRAYRLPRNRFPTRSSCTARRRRVKDCCLQGGLEA